MLCLVVLFLFFCHQLSCDESVVNVSQDIANEQPNSIKPSDSEPSSEVSDDADDEPTEEQTDDDVGIGTRSGRSYREQHKRRVSPVNTAAIVGKPVTLKCRRRSQNINWMFVPLGSNTVMPVAEKCRADNRHVDRYDVDTSFQSCNLEIESVTLDMAGTYSCMDRSQRSTTSSAELIVLESKPLCKSSAEGEKTLAADSEVHISCSVRYSGSLPPVMEWTDEFGQNVSSTSVKTKNYVKSSFVVTAEASALRPYFFQAYFKKIDLPPTRDKPHKGRKVTTAGNAPDYVYTWTSRSVVIKTNENLALHKKTVQISTYTDDDGMEYGSNLAVDGNTNGDFHNRSCSHTLDDEHAWWAVDLGHQTTVGRVRITNRGDDAPERLGNFHIGLTNLSPWTSAPHLDKSSICMHYTASPPAGVPTDILCDPHAAPGRYLFVRLTGTNYLSICELEVYSS